VKVLLSATLYLRQVLCSPEKNSPECDTLFKTSFLQPREKFFRVRHFIQDKFSAAQRKILLSATLYSRQVLCSPEKNSPERDTLFKTSFLQPREKFSRLRHFIQDKLS
jgi:hypothetical protein